MNSEVIELKVNEHEHKIVYLETEVNNIKVENGVQNNQISNLCDKIDKLIDNNNKWLGFAITTIIGLFVTIFISKMGW